jgi:hypothetical protein
MLYIYLFHSLMVQHGFQEVVCGGCFQRLLNKLCCPQVSTLDNKRTYNIFKNTSLDFLYMTLDILIQPSTFLYDLQLFIHADARPVTLNIGPSTLH